MYACLVTWYKTWGLDLCSKFSYTTSLVGENPNVKHMITYVTIVNQIVRPQSASGPSLLHVTDGAGPNSTIKRKKERKKALLRH